MWKTDEEIEDAKAKQTLVVEERAKHARSRTHLFKSFATVQPVVKTDARG